MKRRNISLVIIYELILIVNLQFVLAQSNMSGNHLNLIGRWASGPCEAVKLDGNYLFYGDGAYLVIADISDPVNPVEYGRILTPGSISEIEVDSNVVYVVDMYNGLSVFTVDDLTLIGSYSECGIQKIDVENGYAYTVGRDCYVRVLDVRNPTYPVYMDTFNEWAFNIFVQDQIAYLAVAGNGIKIFNISNPESPTEIASNNYDCSYSFDITVENGIAYMADEDCGVGLIDVTTPENPHLIGRYNESIGNCYNVAYYNGFVYALGYDLHIIDVSDPENPTRVIEYDLDELADIEVSNNYAYIASRFWGVRIFDVSDPSNPIEVARLPAAGLSNTIKIDGDYTYVGQEDYWVNILDISDPANPESVGTYETGRWIQDICIYDSIGLFLTYHEGVDFVDISDPSNPVKLLNFDSGYISFYITANEGYAYLFTGLPDRAEGIIVFDINDLNDIRIIDTLLYDVANRYYDEMIIEDSYLYLTHQGGPSIIDVTNPLDIAVVCTSYYYCDNNDISVRNNIAFIPDYEGLLILDVADKSNLTKISKMKVSDLFSIAISGNYVYASSGDRIYDSRPDSIYVFDISNISSPVIIDTIWTGYQILELEAVGNKLYVADANDGVYIYENNLILSVDNKVNHLQSKLSVNQNYPNPFNPITTIQYELPQQSDVQITIYDLLGKEVKILVSETQNAGIKSVQWDATNVVSGVYFYQIRAGDFLQTRKMVVLK